MTDHDNLEEFADAQAYDAADRSDTGVVYPSGPHQRATAPGLAHARNTRSRRALTTRLTVTAAASGGLVSGPWVIEGLLASE